MILNANDRQTLAAEIATLLVDSYAIGFFEYIVRVLPSGDVQSREFKTATENAVRETVLEAISRTIDSHLGLPEKP